MRNDEDVERGSASRGSTPSSSSARKRGAATPGGGGAATDTGSNPGGMSAMQMLMCIFGLGILAFASTLFYYHSVLGVDHIDLGSLTLADHPMIRNELGQMQKVFKQLAPGFNEYTHFTDQTLSVAGGSGTGGSGDHSDHLQENQPQEQKQAPPMEHHEKNTARSAPEDIATLEKFGTGPHAQYWAQQDQERLARMSHKRAGLEGKTMPTHHLTCPGKERVQFWQDSTLDDWAYETPYLTTGAATKYVTFEPDVGGWNNIRMQMELVLVFAAATGRTLVLPPDQPMYLLDKGKGKDKHHSFADFFPFDYINERVPVISMKAFIDSEARTGKLIHNQNLTPTPPPPGCDGTSGVERDKRNQLWEYLRNVTSCPPWKGMKDFLVIPPRPGMNTTTDLPSEQAVAYEKAMAVFAGDKRYGMDRKPQIYDEYWHDQHVVHFISKPAWGYRLLEHFYTYIHFQDPAMDRYYKRFVRDFVHYVDLIFCKSAMIIEALEKEAVDGKFSSFHVRRGEFQYKAVKIPADQIMHNVGDHIPADRLIFVATDEKKKEFFDAFKTRWPNVRFLDDYFEMAGLKEINPNFLGMIDAMVCTRGEQFIGTWFSTFTGYITRMRGYMDYPDETTWFGDKEHMNRAQTYEFPRFPFYMRENSISWFGIDEDHKDYWDKYFTEHPLFVDPDPWGKKKKKKNGGGGGGGKKGNKGNDKKKHN